MLHLYPASLPWKPQSQHRFLMVKNECRNYNKTKHAILEASSPWVCHCLSVAPCGSSRIDLLPAWAVLIQKLEVQNFLFCFKGPCGGTWWVDQEIDCCCPYLRKLHRQQWSTSLSTYITSCEGISNETGSVSCSRKWALSCLCKIAMWGRKWEGKKFLLLLLFGGCVVLVQIPQQRWWQQPVKAALGGGPH